MTKTEKVMIGAFILILVALGISIYSLGNMVEEAGGIKGMIIDVGKETKDIWREISAD